MRLNIAADHLGFVLREPLALKWQQGGPEVADFGAAKFVSEDDYPVMVTPLAEAVARGMVKRGMVLCGSRVGASIVANRMPGVRPRVCHDTCSARPGGEHEDMRILIIGTCAVGPELAGEIVRSYAGAGFIDDERHVRRWKQLEELEAHNFKPIQPKEKVDYESIETAS